MRTITQLYKSLCYQFDTNSLPLQPSGLKTLLVLLSAISVKETVNLNKLKNHVGAILGNGSTQSDSHYRRLTRFFCTEGHLKFLWQPLLALVAARLRQYESNYKGRERYVVLDAITWRFVKQWHHFMVLSVIYKKVSIPVGFINLAQRGHSCIAQRKMLLRRVNRRYPLAGATLLADREYVGYEWFRFLTREMGMDYLIRIPKGNYAPVFEPNAYFRGLRTIMREKRSRTILLQGERDGLPLFLFMKKDKGYPQDPLILLSSKPLRKQQFTDHYRIRWKIECLFKNLKSNGFHSEDMNLKSYPKVRLMMCIVILSYMLCIDSVINDPKAAGRRPPGKSGKKGCRFSARDSNVYTNNSWIFNGLPTIYYTSLAPQGSNLYYQNVGLSSSKEH